MWLRANRWHYSSDVYLALLADADIAAVAHSQLPGAIRLKIPCNVGRLPGFDRGWLTVQDTTAHGCPLLLAPQDGDAIPDLCAAFGGKSIHLLEIAPAAQAPRWM